MFGLACVVANPIFQEAVFENNVNFFFFHFNSFVVMIPDSKTGLTPKKVSSVLLIVELIRL